MVLIDVKALFGLLLIVCASYECTKPKRAATTDANGGLFPGYPLSYAEFYKTIMDNGGRVSRPYYEVYALQPTYCRPLLRNVAIRWRASPLGYMNKLQDYAGWFTHYGACVQGVLNYTDFSSGVVVQFKFEDVYSGGRVNFIGTIFSNYPQRYLINWNCPENELFGRKCRDGLRMSIISHDVSYELPLQLIDADLYNNGAPTMSNIRWMKTFEPYKQCPFRSDASIVG